MKLIGDWPRKGIGPVVNFSEAELTQAVAVARANGARLAVHTMAREVPAMAVEAGADSIEHGLFLSDCDLVALGERGGSWVPTVIQIEKVIEQLGERSSGGRLLTEGLVNVAANLELAVEAGVHDRPLAAGELSKERCGETDGEQTLSRTHGNMVW